ncbi:hypothetical protein AB0912_25990 [Streptomyces sp. NPDC007084]|uniref:hypothetical protein n=1 Tax=Streptomyces sp. NPDC007084 TaxID=3154313 RepID=UPI003456F566
MPRSRLYAYRVRGTGRGGVVLWTGGEGDEPDRVLTLPPPAVRSGAPVSTERGRARASTERGEVPLPAARRRVPVFTTVRQARRYASRLGRALATPGAGTLELARVQHWLAGPARRRVPPGPVLEAWNFFEDLARGLGETHRLPGQGPVHDSAYDKLFGAGHAAWTPAEERAVRELLTAGADLWHSCPVTVRPRSSARPGASA